MASVWRLAPIRLRFWQATTCDRRSKALRKSMTARLTKQGCFSSHFRIWSYIFRIRIVHLVAATRASKSACSSSRRKMNDSVTFARHGVREIGLKSSHDLDGLTLGIAWMWAFFHDIEKVPDAKHWFIITKSGRARNKANSRVSFAGILPGKGETFVSTFLISLYTSNSLSTIVPSLGQSPSRRLSPGG